MNRVKKNSFLNNSLETKRIKREILENTWYKLYLMQNYEISKDMFKGANLRWSSINSYQSYIRSIYKGILYKNNPKLSINKYIIGLMDSGVEPFPKIDNSVITIKQLIQEKLLTPYEIKTIFSPVGPSLTEVDTSVAWVCCNYTKNNNFSHNIGDTYTRIVENEEEDNNCLSSKVISNIKTNSFSNIFNFNIKADNLQNIYRASFNF